MTASSLPRYNDSRLTDAALALATSHHTASDYLAQAPVLALSVPSKFVGVVTYGDCDRFGKLVENGPSLKDVVRTFGVTMPMRKLLPDVLLVSHLAVIKALAVLDNSTLAQVIPANPERQHQWLTDLKAWTARAARRNVPLHFRWAALALSRDTSHVDEVADFAVRGDRPLSERWSWAQAVEQSREWHRRLNEEARARYAERRAKNRPATKPIDPFEVICKSKLPDDVEVEGVTFRVLRTRAALRDEGKAMHHCVSSYAGEVRRGRCAIVSACRADGSKERATVEVVKGSAVQVKGCCNAAPSPEMVSTIRLYLTRHGGQA